MIGFLLEYRYNTCGGNTLLGQISDRVFFAISVVIVIVVIVIVVVIIPTDEFQHVAGRGQQCFQCISPKHSPSLILLGLFQTCSYLY